MIRTYKPTTSSKRSQKTLIREIDKVRPEKGLTLSIRGAKGRSGGRVSVRHQSIGSRKLYRIIDFKRDKKDIPAKVLSIEYDPNRGPHIALLSYADGEKRYVLAAEGVKTGMTLFSGE